MAPEDSVAWHHKTVSLGVTGGTALLVSQVSGLLVSRLLPNACLLT